ncbi:MAG: Carbonic anhydrase, beta class [Cytophagales bacterium]|jgi:carbonic anhydrase|nr:carbonate dehydratase [Bacteroidota bacterium]MBS1981482.1 carbonate dehydratase [Bacteroidota bacterium]WHZ08583.1 MAG: Carbonic anhydrase, beta class [Cytophagales bacterium]
MQHFKSYENLLRQNKEWVAARNSEDPHFFKRLANLQRPEFLWIGCSDSRVPANQITGTNPGEVFVHRNIANMVVHTDMNLLSVLDYAVSILEVKHVILCGHYGCGGIRAAMDNKQYGIIDNWIRHIKDVHLLYTDELKKFKDERERERALVEYNVVEQVFNLSQTSIIQNSWQKRGGPWIHGWVYDVGDGLIKDLKVSMKENTNLPDIYKLKHH